MIRPAIADPLDLEIQPGGQRVRDLTTTAECTAAVMLLEADMAKIMKHIADHEADPTLRPPGWRTRAQQARTVKKRVRQVILAHAETLARIEGETGDKRRVILRTIREEVGETEFTRMVALAQARNPHLDWSAL